MISSMINCDCDERTRIKINSWKQFEKLKAFFEDQVEKGMFIELPVEEPYFIGYSADGRAMKWYADKLYKCLKCETLWEFVYPNFPAQGSVRKISTMDYMETQWSIYGFRNNDNETTILEEIIKWM